MNPYLKCFCLAGITTIIIFSAIDLCIGVSPNAQIGLFLAKDTTDQHEYKPYYSCGHYARDMAKNASLYNLSIGSCILGYHPTFRGYQNHIVNYIMQDTQIVIIEPQTDQMMYLNDTMYNYYRLYPDGTQVPTYWACNLAPTGIIT